MAIAVTVVKKNADMQDVKLFFSLVFSGNYATGGEVVNLNAVASTTKAPYYVDINGNAGFSFEYVYATGKLIVRTGGTEASAAAYPAGLTADIVRGMAIFPKFG